MSKYLFYLISEFTMNKHYEDEDSKFDKILLIARRIFVVLFILFIIWIVLFKIIGIWKDKWININGDTKNITWDILINTNSDNMQDLWKNYATTWDKIYYKWNLLESVDANTFYVLDKDMEYTANGSVINSDNLLKIFSISERRLGLMHEIDDIIENEINVTDQLKWASENGMYKIKNEYNTLSKLDRGDRYNMTEWQRAKFAIMFLYVKIVKAYSNDKVQMKLALNELKHFIENFDKNILRDEKTDKGLNGIKWDIAMDDHCIYVDGELYACFLDKIFVK